MFDLLDEDIEIPVAKLGDKIGYADIRASEDCKIKVSYNEINLGFGTKYGFNQEFRGNEVQLYFERMNTFSNMTINEIINHEDQHKWHFYTTQIKGNIEKLLKNITKTQLKAPESYPHIYHFALDPNCKKIASREKNSRNPRIYFMVGYYGTIHPLFFDPYHEINP